MTKNKLLELIPCEEGRSSHYKDGYHAALEALLPHVVLRSDLLKYIPSEGDPKKHQPTDEQVEMCKNDLYWYQNQRSLAGCKTKVNIYDFNRGWEYGFGKAIKAQCRGGIQSAED